MNGQKLIRLFLKNCVWGNLPKRHASGFLSIIRELAQKGAQGVILGCTEIGLLIRQEDTEIPLFDTTVIHARKTAMAAVTGRI